MKKYIKILFNFKSNLFLKIFVLFIFLFLVKNIFFTKSFNDEIITLENSKTYELKIPAKALIVKDEYIYYLGNNDIKVDGTKINVGREIGEVDTSNVDLNFKDYLSKKVEILKKETENDNGKLEEFNLDDVLKFIRDKKFYNIFSFLSTKENEVLFGKKYNIDKLFRYSLLNDTINSGKIISKNSGIVLNKIDGLENIYNFSIIDSINDKDFDFNISDNISNIDGIKIVDNLKYYLCIKIKHDVVENLSLDKNIKVNIGNYYANGIIKDIKSGSEYDILIAQFSSAFEEISDKRFVELSIVKSVNNVFELPYSSIISKDGENYVLTVDSFNNIRKVKVSIKFSDTTNSKVYIDSLNNSIGIFSNILKDASMIKEGQIQNNEK